MEYVRYHDPEHQPRRSEVVSVFDLLYSRYSERLQALASRLKDDSRFMSENTIATVLADLQASDESLARLTVQPQKIVQELLPDLDGLTPDEATYVANRCSVDFVISAGSSRRPLGAIEVNGFEFHENRPDRRAKDALKRSILDRAGIPLLVLETTGRDEPRRLREFRLPLAQAA